MLQKNHARYWEVVELLHFGNFVTDCIQFAESANNNNVNSSRRRNLSYL